MPVALLGIFSYMLTDVLVVLWYHFVSGNTNFKQLYIVHSTIFILDPLQKCSSVVFSECQVALPAIIVVSRCRILACIIPHYPKGAYKNRIAMSSPPTSFSQYSVKLGVCFKSYIFVYFVCYLLCACVISISFTALPTKIDLNNSAFQ